MSLRIKTVRNPADGTQRVHVIDEDGNTVEVCRNNAEALTYIREASKA